MKKKTKNFSFYPFNPKRFFSLISPDELTLRANSEYIGIRLLEPEENWWYGTTLDSSRAGIFPANYVEVIQEDKNIKATSKNHEGTMNPIAKVEGLSGLNNGAVATEKPGCCCAVQ